MLTHERIKKAYKLMCQTDYQAEYPALIPSKLKGRVIKINRKTRNRRCP